jgi:hypothetical protein
LCQRYYYKIKSNSTAYSLSTSGQCASAVNGICYAQFPVTMRTKPTAIEQSGTAGDYRVFNAATSQVVCTSVPVFNVLTTESMAIIEFGVASGLVAGNSTGIYAVNTNAYLGWSAEL